MTAGSLNRRWKIALLAVVAGGAVFASSLRAEAFPGGPTVLALLPRPLTVMLDRDRLGSAEPGKDGRFHLALDERTQGELTIDPRLQKMVERVLGAHKTPYGSAVLLNIADGRVVAMAGRSSVEPQKTAADLCLTPWAPAASIFKLVTASALLAAGVSAKTRVCYHDGIHSVEESNLVDHPKLDESCASFSYGLAKSQNAIIARLANDYLSPERLVRAARALGFDDSVPWDVTMQPSNTSIPSERLPFARVAAGFFHTTLSPLHAAWMAATIARGGVTPQLHLVAKAVDASGPREMLINGNKRILDEDVARTVARMMIGTTEFGTARLAFHTKEGKSRLPGVLVAGKTGSLNRHGAGPFLMYSWFVGFAPATRPKVAFAVLIGNGDSHMIRASYVAREILEGYFRKGPEPMLAAR